MAQETLDSWLNVDFVQMVLRAAEDDTIQVLDISTEAATNKGDNYASLIYRTAVDYTTKKSGNEERIKKNIITKVAPMLDGVHKDLIEKSGLFDREIMMFTDTLIKMNKILEPEKPLSARGLYARKASPALLVIEDLKALGFRMADRQAGLDLDHSLLAIQGLARFHASSVAVCEKYPETKEMYKQGMINNNNPEEMKGFFIQGVKTLGTEAAKWPDLDPKYAKKITNISDRIYEKMSDICASRPDDFNVINHGDFWVNNMLFKYDDAGKVIEHICVDFQLSFYTTPAIDLQYFFNTSLPDDSLVKNSDLLLEEYRRTLSATMARLGCQTEPPTMERLKKSMDERAHYGMVAAFCVLPLCLADKSKVVGLDEMMGADGTYTNPAYSNDLYKKAIFRRVKQFDEMGLLDF